MQWLIDLILAKITGLIVLWSGAVIDIPTGWHLCDGTAGTPDLRNQFLVGAGDTYAVDANGGALTHTHPFTGDGHNHLITTGFSMPIGTDFNNTVSSSQATGTTDATDHKPPYYALAYIQKI